MRYRQLSGDCGIVKTLEHLRKKTPSPDAGKGFVDDRAVAGMFDKIEELRIRYPAIRQTKGKIAVEIAGRADASFGRPSVFPIRSVPRGAEGPRNYGKQL